jgi:hypothetical protein
MSRREMSEIDELSRRVAELSRLVAEERVLSRVADYFHDALVPTPHFMAHGVRATHRPLTKIVRRAAQSYGFEIMDAAALFHAPRFSLWHGTIGALFGPMAVVLYFDDQHRGVAIFGVPTDPITHYVRFSLPEGARDPEVDLGDINLVSASPARQRGSA